MLKTSRQFFHPEVNLWVGLLTGLARMAEAHTARGGSVLDHMPPLKWLSGKLKVQMLVVHNASSCLVWAPDGLGICVHDWGLPSDERSKGGIPECGGEGGSPLLPGNSARAFRTYRGLALQPAQNVGGLNVLGALDVLTSLANAYLELRFERNQVNWWWQSSCPLHGDLARACWPVLYDSLFGFHEQSKHVQVDTFSRHTSGVVREME